MTVRRSFFALLTSAAVAVTVAAPAAAAAPYARLVTCPPPSSQAPIGEPLDGFAITRLPVGIGALVSDFEYEWEEVAFGSRVWERGPDPEGAYSVDLTVKVLRGQRLTDLAALRDYLAEYHEQDPDGWALTEFDHHGEVGFHTAREAFWLVEPGLAVEVTVDTERYSPRTLIRTACGVERAE